MKARQLLRVTFLLWVGTISAANAQGPPPFPPSYPDHSKLLILRDLEGNERPITQVAKRSIRIAAARVSPSDTA